MAGVVRMLKDADNYCLCRLVWKLVSRIGCSAIRWCRPKTCRTIPTTHALAIASEAIASLIKLVCGCCAIHTPTDPMCSSTRPQGRP